MRISLLSSSAFIILRPPWSSSSHRPLSGQAQSQPLFRRRIVFTLRPPWSSCRLPQPFSFHSKCVSACCLRQSFHDSTTAVVDPQQYVPPSSGPNNEHVCSSIQVLVISPQLRPSFDAVCFHLFISSSNRHSTCTIARTGRLVAPWSVKKTQHFLHLN